MTLPSDYQTYIHQSRYARLLPDQTRRETWEETVDRYINYFQSRSPFPLDEVREAILNLEVMPSMRALMTAGLALDLDNVAGYNCSYLPIDSPSSYAEMMYILMCGTGNGFSVERAYTNQLPRISNQMTKSGKVIVVDDSRIGWAEAFHTLLINLFNGNRVKWDTSLIRPAGSPLRTFGGRASGPTPLEELFEFTTKLFVDAKGEKLRPVECHDLACKVADVVVMGGVRRSALISLSDLDDEEMRTAKTGQWWEDAPHRQLSNNSAVYTRTPSPVQFLREWASLIESKSGERGIFNRQASQRTAARSGRRRGDVEFGTNPCSEIILRPYQFCNLSEVVVRESDTRDSLARKVRLATLLGTLQSTLTSFRFLRPIWKANCEEERLLGVSLTGIMDNPLTGGPSENLKETLVHLRGVAVEANREMARGLGIAPSVAITCVKPSGTVSQLVDSSSGIHPRYSPYYIRRVTTDKKDPIYRFLVSQKVPTEDSLYRPDSNAVHSFPIASPSNAIIREDLSAIDQLRVWLTYARNWCEHKPSTTIYVREGEWLGVGDWVYRHFDEMSGVSFLPYSDHIYKQAPYTPITPTQYTELQAAMPKVEWELLPLFENGELGEGSRELACSAGVCEL